MNLLVGRRRTLRGIERDLADSDPRLATLLADFTQLTRDEDMPAAEELKLGPISMLTRLRSAAGPNRPPEYSRSLFWTFVLFAILVTLPYAVMIGGTGHCVTQACTRAVHGTASGFHNPGNAVNPGILPNSNVRARDFAASLVSRTGTVDADESDVDATSGGAILQERRERPSGYGNSSNAVGGAKPLPESWAWARPLVPAWRS
jgi:hypothetical protein